MGKIIKQNTKKNKENENEFFNDWCSDAYPRS